MIVDFHTHTFPPALAPKALANLSGASGTAPFTDGTAQGLRDSMRAAGIDLSVVLPVATNPAKCGHINDASLREMEQAEDQSLVFFGAMHPEFSDWHAELGRIAAMGFRGVKLHPVYQGVDFDDRRYLRILERAGELGLTVVTHAGDDIGFPGVIHCSPEMIERAIRQVGPVRLVAAHMGGWRNWERVTSCLGPLPSVYLDTAISTGTVHTLPDGRFHGESLSLLQEDAFLDFVAAFGANRILFGTDSPWRSQAESLAWLRHLPLSAEKLTLMLGGNAETLLA